MDSLPTIIRKNGHTYIKIQEWQKSFIYKQMGQDNTKVIAFEVFHKKIKGERLLNGKTLPEKMIFPSNECFGRWAWTYKYWEDAFIKAYEIEHLIK